MPNAETKPLLQTLLEAGYPKEDVYNHCSDLYVYVTPLTTSVINKWFAEAGLKKAVFVSTFRDNITGRPMYDIAFQWYPI